jgi:hypothetical protein
MMKRLAISAAALVAGMSVASAAVLDGRWSIVPGSCDAEYADDIMTIDTVAEQIGFYESGCDIADLRQVGQFEGAWTATLQCSGEGETWIDKVVFGYFAPFDGGEDQLALIYMNDGYAVIYRRCPVKQ